MDKQKVDNEHVVIIIVCHVKWHGHSCLRLWCSGSVLLTMNPSKPLSQMIRIIFLSAHKHLEITQALHSYSLIYTHISFDMNFEYLENMFHLFMHLLTLLIFLNTEVLHIFYFVPVLSPLKFKISV